MVKVQKKTLLVTTSVAIVVALVAFMVVPSILANTLSDYAYALDPQNWQGVDTTAGTAGSSTLPFMGDHSAQIDTKGFAFQRVSSDTIKQYNCTTELIVQVTAATATSNRTVSVTGTVTVNDTIYTITSGKAFLSREDKTFYLNCAGTDGSGNAIALKFGGQYFWWGGHAYALRTKGLLQTADGQMLLLQRGIARIS